MIKNHKPQQNTRGQDCCMKNRVNEIMYWCDVWSCLNSQSKVWKRDMQAYIFLDRCIKIYPHSMWTLNGLINLEAIWWWYRLSIRFRSLWLTPNITWYISLCGVISPQPLKKRDLNIFYVDISSPVYLSGDLLQNCKVTKESQETWNIKLVGVLHSSYCIPLKRFTCTFRTCTCDPRYMNACAQSFFNLLLVWQPYFHL